MGLVPPLVLPRLDARGARPHNQSVEVFMTTFPGNSPAVEPLPRTLRFCKTCQKQTSHEIRAGAGVIAAICTMCIARALRYELDRD